MPFDDISQVKELSDLLYKNIAGWEQSTLRRIGKRIGEYGKLSIADIQAINNVAIVKKDMEEITKELAKISGKNVEMINEMYQKSLAERHLLNRPLYDYRNVKFAPFEENRALQAIARAYAKSTSETMLNLSKTKALAILDHTGKAKGLSEFYTSALDKAVMQVASDTADFHSAMRSVITDMGSSGIRVDYGGITRRLDTVVRQNLMWGAKQAATEYSDMIGKELGCDGIEIDWHTNPRPSHEFMQGKQYALGHGKTVRGVYYPSADDALKALEDYGCNHYKTPIICGVSEPRYSADELKRLAEQNAKRYTIGDEEYSGYEVTQIQRRIETELRKSRETKEIARASGDKALVRQCGERINKLTAKYEEIEKATGIHGDIIRTTITRPKK